MFPFGAAKIGIIFYITMISRFFSSPYCISDAKLVPLHRENRLHLSKLQINLHLLSVCTIFAPK